MRVVLVINSLQGGGAEKFVLTLGDALATLGHEVHVVYFQDKIEHELSPRLYYQLVSFEKVQKRVPKLLQYRIFARVVDKFLASLVPDLVLVNLYRAYEVFFYSKLVNQDVTINFIIHNQLSAKLNWQNLSQRKRQYYQQVYTRYPAVAVSHGVAQDFVKLFGSAASITTIHNPIDQARIIEQASQFVPPFKDYIVHVGSFKAQKNHALLLQAYANTSRRYALVLVGQGQLSEAIHDLVNKLGLSDKVKMIGFQPNPYPFIKHAHGMVLSSDFEGFALVLAEALALGVPAISTDCPSGPNEILPQKNLVPVGDSHELSVKLEALMQRPADFFAPFNQQFLPQNVAQQYLAFAQYRNTSSNKNNLAIP